MADEFSTAAVCGGGGWWNPTRNMFGPSLCSASINDIEASLMQDNERGERNNNYGSMVEEDLNYGQQSSDFSSLTSFTSSSQELSTSFPITSYNNYPPNFPKSMFDTDPQQCLISSQPVISYAPAMTTTTANYGANSSDFPPSTPFPSTISLWNSSATLNDVGSCFFPSPTFADNKSVITGKSNGGTKELRDSSCLANKTINEPDFKRPRIETPSPLPTFKVRKEKLGDRITALQQLVSPFGKTDTASVLHEVIEYIKFLHDQVNVLITPYKKNGSPSDQHFQPNVEEVLDEERLSKQDLRARGLCVVPMSSTFHVAPETTTDFWTPMFGANFR